MYIRRVSSKTKDGKIVKKRDTICSIRLLWKYFPSTLCIFMFQKDKIRHFSASFNYLPLDIFSKKKPWNFLAISFNRKSIDLSFWRTPWKRASFYFHDISNLSFHGRIIFFAVALWLKTTHTHTHTHTLYNREFLWEIKKCKNTYNMWKYTKPHPK